MKYFLDTNIILILFQGRNNELKKKIVEVLTNDKNKFFASVISLNEITQLYRKKKIIGLDYDKNYNTAEKLIKAITKRLSMVSFLPFEAKHALIVCKLSFVSNHNDPNDLAIIAHSMGEKSVVISTDDKFPNYIEQGAKILHNPR